MNAAPETLRALHADHVLPGDAPPVTDGAVVLRGSTVLDVGAAGDVLPRHGVAAERVRGVIFPGLVNAHTHLELSALAGRVPGGAGFVSWVDRLVKVRAGVTVLERDRAIASAVGELTRTATVAVGEVTNELAAVTALAAAGIGGVVFHEVFGLDAHAALSAVHRLEGGPPADGSGRAWPPSLTYAPSAHTLYTVHVEALPRLVALGLRMAGRTSLHLAEHPAERSALERGDGAFVAWVEARTGASYRSPRARLFDLADAVGALAPGVLLVHLADARPDEIARVAASGASVCLCPRSNLWVEGRLPPLAELLASGIAPALGTDSLASGPSLDVLEEARTLALHHVDVAPWQFVRMATDGGARALGLPRLGRIAAGATPGLYAVQADIDGDPAAWLLHHTDAERVALVPHRNVVSP